MLQVVACTLMVTLDCLVAFWVQTKFYNLDPTTAKNILDAGFDNDFLGQDSISQNRGFDKLFGGPEE